jgi:hypothetical protein
MILQINDEGLKVEQPRLRFILACITYTPVTVSEELVVENIRDEITRLPYAGLD